VFYEVIMPWPKGEPRGDGTVEARVRPTEISAALYHDVSVRAARLKMTTRAAMEQALNAWLVVTEEEAEEEASENP
jgi:hypothetical protein